MALLGEIAIRARGEIPETWDALSRSTTYGDIQLQTRIDFVKFRLFGQICPQHLEATLYDAAKLMLAAKMVALNVAPGGADFWANQMVMETTRGTDETRTYPDRIASLWRIHARLLTEVTELQGSISGLTPTKRVGVPTTNITGPFRTSDPQAFPIGYTTTAIPALTFEGAWLLP